MTPKVRNLIIFLLVIIGILAGVGGFYFAKTSNLEKNRTANSNTIKNTASVSTTTNANVNANTNTAVSTVTQPAALGNRPSSPSDTVVVAQGEILSQIAEKVGVSWMKIAEANGVEADKIKAGQTLIIPKNNQISYTVNQEKAASLQKDTDGGKYPFRISAVETAKSDSSPVYGLTTTDTFSQTQIDENAGTATVSAVKADKTYIISLVQPVTKGAKGIWAISLIKPQ